MTLVPNLKVSVGVGAVKKEHAFDLGCDKQKVIIECKSHRWTTGDNVPSAKLTVWNEAMYYFASAPNEYRKIMFVLKDVSDKRDETLAEYYLRTYEHLVPSDVEFWEYDEITKEAKKCKHLTHMSLPPVNRQYKIKGIKIGVFSLCQFNRSPTLAFIQVTSSYCNKQILRVFYTAVLKACRAVAEMAGVLEYIG